MQSGRLADTAGRWASLLGHEIEKIDDQYHVRLDEGVLRFVPPTDDRGDGVCAVDMRATNGQPRSTALCGL